MCWLFLILSILQLFVRFRGDPHTTFRASQTSVALILSDISWVNEVWGLQIIMITVVLCLPNLI